ncbi:hypothetical protein HanRHA438_Chr04g0152291 [Helianthus annuus]|nr:hypothetical protein HanRHA438_Chr04g0152291 [Helianthus annuus]
MRKKPVSYEWFSYIRISSQIRRKSRVVTHFLRKMVSEILIFLVVLGRKQFFVNVFINSSNIFYYKDNIIL